MLCCIAIFSLREPLKFRWAGGGRLGPARGGRMTGKSSRFSSGEMLRSCRLQSHHIEIVPLFLHKCLNSDPGPRVLHRTAADTADKDFSVRS